MRLADLSPQWLVQDGRRVGFIFKSPTKPEFWQSCFVGRTPWRKEQWALFAEVVPEGSRQMVQGCNPAAIWSCPSDINGDVTWDDLSVTPSLDGSAGGLWHGRITKGEIVGGL